MPPIPEKSPTSFKSTPWIWSANPEFQCRHLREEPSQTLAVYSRKLIFLSLRPQRYVREARSCGLAKRGTGDSDPRGCRSGRCLPATHALRDGILPLSNIRGPHEVGDGNTDIPGRNEATA